MTTFKNGDTVEILSIDAPRIDLHVGDVGIVQQVVAGEGEPLLRVRMNRTGNLVEMYARRFLLTIMQTPAMEEQVGGDHYKTLGIQPMELVLANMGYDAFKGACYVKINKYMIRNKDNEVEQLKKAKHVLSMWIEEAEKRND